MNTPHSNQRTWLKSYPHGVNHEIDLTQYQSIMTVFEDAIKKYGSQVAFSNMGQKISFNDLENKSAAFASFLQHELHLKKGDRIAIQMPNLLQFPIVLFAALRLGLVIVNTNPLYTPHEMQHQFRDSGAKAIVILANFASNLQKILNNTEIESVIITEIGDELSFPKSLIVNSVVKYIKKMVPTYHLPTAYRWSQALSIGSQKTHTPEVLNLNDLAFLQYTGGTTGVSKGAELTHQNVVANMEQIVCWMNGTLESGKEKIITALPLYHIFSLTVNCLALMRYGAENILITNPRDIPEFIKIMKKSDFTIMTGVNTLFNALMNHSEFASIDFKKVKLSVAGAMALQKSVAEKWKSLTRTPVFEGYGLTEASPVVCCNPITENLDKVGTIGLPLPSTQVCLLDENGNEVLPGTEGELCVKGPQVMRGYWGRPDETEKVIINGWLKTGDIAIQDNDGYFKIVDRKKDMILVSGFNVYPNEVEEAVAAHPGVLEVAAVGVPDEKTGEAVKVFVVKKDPELTEKEITSFAKNSLTNYKVPHLVEFRTELPKTNVGKILRRALRESK